MAKTYKSADKIRASLSLKIVVNIVPNFAVVDFVFVGFQIRKQLMR